MRRLAAGLLVIGVLAGCRPDTVAVSFRPTVGTTYRYEVRVTAESTTAIAGSAPERKTETVRLVAEQTVLDSGADGVRVRVLVGEPGSTPQAFVVRFDRSAGLESIEADAGTPADIAGAIGVPEIFPGATGAPPTRLGPGDRWTIDRRVVVPGAARRARIHTDGQLVELGREGEAKVARLSTSTDLPLATTSGSVRLRGSQRITQRATYDLGDGTVRRATATTVGHFRLEVEPPAGTAAEPVPGTLDVRVTSTTRRIES